MSKVIVITGATNGLGRACAQDLASLGHRLIPIAQSRERGEAVIAALPNDNGVVKHTLYIADAASIPNLQRVSSEIISAEPNGIDVLLNNAGAMFDGSQFVVTPTGHSIHKTHAVNHLGYFVLALSLKPALKRGSKVINTGSFAQAHVKWDAKSQLDDQALRGFPAYYHSKLCNMLFTRSLAENGKQTVSM